MSQTLGQSDRQLASLARGTGANLAGFVFRVAFTFLLSIVAARLYGVEAVGIYSLGLSVVFLLSILAQIGFGPTLTRYVATFRAEKKYAGIRQTLRWSLIITVPTSLVFALLLIFAAEPIAELFGEPKLVPSFKVLSLAVPALTLATLLGGFTRGFKRMEDQVIALDIVRTAVELFVAIGMALLGAKLLGLQAAFAVSVVVAALTITIFARRLLAQLPTDSEPVMQAQVDVKQLLAYALPIWVTMVLVNASGRISILLLGLWGDTVSVGMYEILGRVMALGLAFLLSSNLMFGPVVADLAKRHQLAELSRSYKAITRWVLSISIPYFILLIFFGAWILQIFGDSFVVGASALRVLALAAMFNVGTGSSGIILMMAGYPKYSAMNEAINLIIIIVLGFLLIPEYGLLGAVWAVSAGIVVVNSLRLLLVWRHLQIHPYSWLLTKNVAASLAMAAVSFLWVNLVPSFGYEWLVAVAGMVVAGLVYVLVLVWLGLALEDVELLRYAAQRYLKRSGA